MTHHTIIDSVIDIKDKLAALDTHALANMVLKAYPPKLKKLRKEFFARYEDTADEYGFDLNAVRFWEPLCRFFFEDYFQVKVLGLENIPSEGGAILIGNHSGVLPVDAFMLFESMYHNHPSPRRIRYLAHEWFNQTPSLKGFVCGLGGVPARFSVAMKLLEKEELVFFYPEGLRGVSKPFSKRYQTMEFNPGFVKAALLTGKPIIPIATVGLDEIYPLLGTIPFVAKLWGTPFYPVTYTFPWLPFPSSCIPLPIKTLIKIGKPVYLNYPPEAALDRGLRTRLAREFQNLTQRELDFLLSKRKSPFADWDLEALR
ncbi:MAG TPA: 1-acyl-sn-glycerol-3-phosphate acyltransferase [Oculatellaceae cyanobacterium]